MTKGLWDHMARKLSSKQKQRVLRLAKERHRRGLVRNRNHDFLIEEFHKNRPLINRIPRTYSPITFDGVFSILKNRNQVIRYTNDIDKLLRQEVDINMDLSKSTNADLPTICMLSAYMLDRRTPGKHLQVTLPPTNSAHHTIWGESQFDRMIVRQRRRDFNSGRFLSRSDNFVNGVVIRDVLDRTVEHFGKEHTSKLRELNSIIGEIVENTALHAHPKKTRKIPWIINTHSIEGSDYREREYCIIDLGVGIYDSIKENVDRWNTTRAKVLHRLTNALDSTSTQSRFLSKNIPIGIGSASNEATRGKGVKAVYELAQAAVYTDFDIITNKAHVNIKDIGSVSKDSESSLNGTIYYWKIRIDG